MFVLKVLSWSEVTLRELKFYAGLNTKAEILVDGDKRVVVVVD